MSRVPDAVQRFLAVHRRAGAHVDMGPGSAAHHHSASKTAVNALSVLRSLGSTKPISPLQPGHAVRTVDRRLRKYARSPAGFPARDSRNAIARWTRTKFSTEYPCSQTDSVWLRPASVLSQYGHL